MPNLPTSRYFRRVRRLRTTGGHTALIHHRAQTRAEELRVRVPRMRKPRRVLLHLIRPEDIPFLSPLRKLRERHLALLHAQLGADELAAAWTEGRAMAFEEAVEYALEPDEAPPRRPEGAKILEGKPPPTN